ncbi:MAG: phage tail tube protein [Trebonia sp.]
MAQVFGIVDLYFGEQQIDVEEGCTLKLGGVLNKRVIAGRKVFAAGQMMASEIDGTTVLQAGVDPTTMFGTAAQELQAHLDTGQVLTWGDAFVEEAIELSSGEGKVKFKLVAGAPQVLVPQS